MKKIDKSKKRLTVGAEKLRELRDAQLNQVVGGRDPTDACDMSSHACCHSAACFSSLC